MKYYLFIFLMAGFLLPLENTQAEFSILSRNTTQGDCSPIVTGDIKSMTLNCHNSTIPEAALTSLESSLIDMVEKRMEQMLTPEEVEQLMADLRQEINTWERRYHDLETSIEEGLLVDPDNQRLKEAEAALSQGSFEKAATILEELAKEQEKEVDKAAGYQYRAGQAFQLAFKLQKALKNFARAYQYRPENSEYAVSYSNSLLIAGYYKEAREILSEIIDNEKNGSGFYYISAKYLLFTLLMDEGGWGGKVTEMDQLLESLIDRIKAMTTEENHAQSIMIISDIKGRYATFLISRLKRRDKAKEILLEVISSQKKAIDSGHHLSDDFLFFFQ